ncbi:MAG TPA: hypothetical protein VF145_00090 [Chitinophagaceae bacterium]
MKTPSPRDRRESPILKAYSIQELANMYGVGIKTFKHWLKAFRDEIGPRIGRFYFVSQVEIIFKRLGTPEYSPDRIPPRGK